MKTVQITVPAHRQPRFDAWLNAREFPNVPKTLDLPKATELKILRPQFYNALYLVWEMKG